MISENVAIAALSCLGGALGGGGIVTILNRILGHKEKNKELSDDLARFYGDQIKDLAAKSQEQYENLQKRYDSVTADLSDQIKTLTTKLTVLNRWIIIDNAKYRTWLEDELRKRDPDIQIPDCPEPPDVFHDIFVDEESESDSDVEIVPPEE